MVDLLILGTVFMPILAINHLIAIADVRVEDFKLHKQLMEDLVGVFRKNL